MKIIDISKYRRHKVRQADQQTRAAEILASINWNEWLPPGQLLPEDGAPVDK